MSVNTSDHGQEILQRLDDVLDPELGIGLVSLGLIYRIHIDDNDSVSVWMTLTTPGCPMHATITRDVERALRDISWISDVSVNLVFEPPWSPERLSDSARMQLAG